MGDVFPKVTLVGPIAHGLTAHNSKKRIHWNQLNRYLFDLIENTLKVTIYPIG
jgi:hypothetical protein